MKGLGLGHAAAQGRARRTQSLGSENSVSRRRGCTAFSFPYFSTSMEQETWKYLCRSTWLKDCS